MSFAVEGEWGLRWRIRVGFNELQSYSQVAALLNVPLSSVQRYLTDPAYELSPSEVGLAVTNLYRLPFHREEGGSTATHSWHYDQWPLWTDARLDALVLPADCEYYIWHYWATYPGAEDQFRSYGPFSPDGVTPQESGREITNDNPAMLAECLVYVRTGV